MFLGYCFNSFDFVTATKSSAILLITAFTALSLCNFDMYKIISLKNLKRSNSLKNLKRSNSELLELHQKILKSCFLNMSSLSLSSSESKFS